MFLNVAAGVVAACTVLIVLLMLVLAFMGVMIHNKLEEVQKLFEDFLKRISKTIEDDK